MASLYDRTIQESTLFELFESDAYSDTLKALKVAQADIVAKILSIEGDTWTKSRLNAVKVAIDEAVALAYSKTLPTLQTELAGIATVTAQNMLLTEFVSVPVSVLDTITSNTFQVQGYDAKALFKTISDNHARQLSVLVASGVAQGKTANSLISELITKNSALSKAQLKNSIFTLITDARAVSRYDSYSKMEKSGVIKGYEYVSVLDSRTSEYCRDHDGRRYYKDISEIQHLINTHWHCRSVFVPITKSTTKDTRASQFGEVPDEPYSKWFSRQSDAFQLTTLGKAKYAGYKNGTYTIGGLPDVRGKTLSLDTIKSTLKRD